MLSIARSCQAAWSLPVRLMTPALPATFYLVQGPEALSSLKKNYVKYQGDQGYF